jgi:outer membrane lipoprotein LolB
VALVGLATGCATFQPTTAESAPENIWSGRLVLQTFADPPTQLSAAFELQGAPENGHLSLLTPLGTTFARVYWRPGLVELHGTGPVKTFPHMDALTTTLAGAPLPIEALFTWLKGAETPAAGWQVDLSGIDAGRLSARRQTPPPQAEIRLVLDRTHQSPP